MVVDDFHVVGVAIPPHEADAILIIDPDAVLALALAVQRFQPVSGRHTQKLTKVFAISSLHQTLIAALAPISHGAAETMNCQNNCIEISLGGIVDPHYG